MDEYESSGYSRWECKHHVVLIPKFRRKKLYKELRKYGMRRDPGVYTRAGGRRPASGSDANVATRTYHRSPMKDSLATGSSPNEGKLLPSWRDERLSPCALW
jgi:hypothetical protein